MGGGGGGVGGWGVVVVVVLLVIAKCNIFRGWVMLYFCSNV